jgi:Septum formation initiator.
MRKKNILHMFLCAEIIVFGWFYYAGNQGLRSVYALGCENEKVTVEIGNVKQEIATLETTIKAWQTDSFYKEKLAREDLHLANPQEEIYLV